MHPDSRQKPARKVRHVPAPQVGVGDLSVFERRPFVQPSLVDYWSVDNECAHDQLPHEACGPCGRLASPAPSSQLQAVVESERALHRAA
jgi:hypothetical protein